MENLPTTASWVDSELFKEWTRLSLEESKNQIKPRGYWSYDNNDKKYKYIEYL